MKIETRLVPAESTWPLRSLVLRPDLRPEGCEFEGDFATSSFHVAVFVEGHVRCIASLVEQGFQEQPGMSPSYRLRGMATHPDFRRRGLARQAIELIEKELSKRAAQVLWFNARIGALDFYRQMGFSEIGELFEMPGIGLHKVMYKNRLSR